MADTILFNRNGLEVSRDDAGNYRTIGSERQIIRELSNDLVMYRGLFERALSYVNKVFQVCSENDRPLLPDFLTIGSDKFEGVVKLAEEYIKLRDAKEPNDNNGYCNRCGRYRGGP